MPPFSSACFWIKAASSRPASGYVYAARVSMERSEMRVGNGKVANLTPGMNVAVEIRTGERRVIEFILSPIFKSIKESTRER